MESLLLLGAVAACAGMMWFMMRGMRDNDAASKKEGSGADATGLRSQVEELERRLKADKDRGPVQRSQD